MLNPLLLCLVSSATTALTASALDSSSAALNSLDNIGTLVEIGSSGESGDGHSHSHGGGSGSDDVHKYWSAMPSSPSTYEVVVGDKLSFKYTEYHNVYLMPSQEAYWSCDFSAATELASDSYGGGEGSFPNVYEAVVTATGCSANSVPRRHLSPPLPGTAQLMPPRAPRRRRGSVPSLPPPQIALTDSWPPPRAPPVAPAGPLEIHRAAHAPPRGPSA